MAVKWLTTTFPGVRYYKHELRKHGVKYDQYYAVRFQIDGKSFEQGLGWASEGMSAEKAYNVRCELKDAAKTGKGASTLKERRRIKAIEDEATPIFKDACEKFLEYCGRSLRKRSVRHYKDGLEKARSFVPSKGTGKLEDWKIDEIQRRHLAALVDKIAKDSPSVAIQVRSSLSALYAWAVQSPQEYVQANIVRDIPRPPKPTPRERYLTFEEAGSLWGELDKAEEIAMTGGDGKTDHERHQARENAGDPAMIRLLKFSLLVGCRISEALEMTHKEVDGEWWTVPAVRFKGKRPHRVFLTPTAKSLIEGKGKYVFPSSRSGRRKKVGEPFDPSSVSRYLKRKEYFGLDKFTCHDFRRTLGSGLAMLGFGMDAIGATIGHKLQGVTAEHYVRHTYDAEKQKAMICWEAHLLKLANKEEAKADVIPIQRR